MNVRYTRDKGRKSFLFLVGGKPKRIGKGGSRRYARNFGERPRNPGRRSPEEGRNKKTKK